MPTTTEALLHLPQEQMWAAVHRFSAEEAAALVISLLDAGHPPASLVRDLLTPVQTEVGRRWQANLLTASDEHATTAVVDGALAALELTGSIMSSGDRGTLAVICAPGDWHTMPARMFAQLCRWDGWRVAFVGGMLPVADLQPWLERARPDGVIITSCMSLFIPGVRRIVDVVAPLGIPCVAGGAGLGPDGRRAHGVGAGWAGSLSELSEALVAGVPPESALDRHARYAEAAVLDVIGPDLAEKALQAVLEDADRSAMEVMRSTEAIAQGCRSLVEALAAAVLCGDESLFAEHRFWLQELLVNRGVPAGILRGYVRHLADDLPVSCPRAMAVLGAGVVREPARRAARGR